MAITLTTCADIFLLQANRGGWLPLIVDAPPPASAVDIGWPRVGTGAAAALAEDTPPTIAPWVEVGVVNPPDTQVC